MIKSEHWARWEHLEDEAENSVGQDAGQMEGACDEQPGTCVAPATPAPSAGKDAGPQTRAHEVEPN